MISSIVDEIQRKFKRRRIEYAILVVLNVVGLVAMRQDLRPGPSFGLVLSSAGIAWTLAQGRQKRNTLPEMSTDRLYAEIVELVAVILLIAAFVFVILRFNVNIPELKAHGLLMSLSFVLSTVFAEWIWWRFIFPQLNPAQQLNYAVNLRSSILSMITLSQWKRVFRWKDTQ